MKTLLLVAVALLAGCGSGSDSAPSITSVKISQVGKYSLSQITKQNSPTAAPFSMYSSVTMSYPEWVASLWVGATSWTKSQNDSGFTSSIYGSYALSPSISGQTGTFLLDIPSYFPHSGKYELVDDHTLKLIYDPTLGYVGYCQWIETWTKVSDIP